MKKIIKRITSIGMASLAVMALALGFAPEASALATRQVNLWSSANITATATSSSIRTQYGPTDALGSGIYRAFSSATVQISCAVVSGTSPSATLTADASWDNGATWRPFGFVDAAGATSAFSAVTSGTSTQHRNLPRPLPPMLRFVWTISGTSPVFTISTNMILGE